MSASLGLLWCLAKGTSHFYHSLLLPLCHFGIVKQVRVRRMTPVKQECKADFSSGSPGHTRVSTRTDSAIARAYFWSARSCTNDLKGAIPVPAHAINIGTVGSAGGWKPSLDGLTAAWILAPG